MVVLLACQTDLLVIEVAIMLHELIKFLDDDMLDDYWYDFAICECERILKELTDNEWAELIRVIPSKSSRWNIRLVECLGNINNRYAMECIKASLFIPNEDLFVACIDVLRDMDITFLQSNVLRDIKYKASIIMEKTDSPPIQLIIDTFLKKIYSLQ